MKPPKHPTASHAESVAVSAPESGRWSIGAIFVLLLGATLAAYFPALRGEFLWDDAGHVTAAALRSWAGLG
eukprot:gene1302-1624_t